MMKRRLLLPLLLAAVGAPPVHGGFGISKLNAPIVIVRPPDVTLRGRTFDVKLGEGVSFPDQQGLRLTFERALSSTLTPSPDKPDLTIRYSVSNYQPVSSRTFTVSESKYIKVGEESYTDKNGKSQTRDKYDNRNVPVEYWESAGALAITIQTFDSEGVMIDTFTVAKDIGSKRVIAENGVSKLSANQPLPSHPAMLSILMNRAAGDMHRRYAKTKRTEMAMLAKDDPLKAGSESAQRGDWSAALMQWKDARLKDDPEYRLFNMAVANEALAYSAYDKTEDAKQAEPFFVEAMRLYEEAKRLNAKEKYFERASSRIEVFRTNMERGARIQETLARDIEEAKQTAAREGAQRAQKEREEQERLATLDDKREDSAMEKEYRADVRIRMRNLETVAPEDEAKWRADGSIFKLESLQIDRVIHQERNWHATMRGGLAKYREVFAEFVTDQRLNGEERERLKVRQKLLELTDADVAGIESTFGEFTDDTKVKPKPSTAGTAAAGPKPLAVPRQALMPKKK